MFKIVEKPMQRSATTGGHAQPPTAGYFPKDILSIEFNPGRKLAHFVVELSNIPGALEHSAALATKNSVNILSGFHHAPSASKLAFWSFFADFTDSKINPAEFASELRALPSTVDVRTHVPPNGFLIDTFDFPLRWGARRAIMMRNESIGSIFARINAIFGDGPAARVVLYEMGEAAGRSIFNGLVTEIGLDVFKKELSQVLGLYMASGWGLFELLHADFDKKTAAIRVKDNFECVYYRGQATTPRGNFVRGHLAGWFSGLFGVRVEVMENYCVAKGDECCNFTIESAGT
jgi:predicted hydrocarbon binding protein